MTTTSIGARWEHFAPSEHRTLAPEGIRSRLLCGLAWTTLTRVATFLFTWSTVWPGLGMAVFVARARTGFADDVAYADLSVAAVLGLAAIIGAVAVRTGSTPRGLTFARWLGWIYLIDNVLYIGGLLIAAIVLAIHVPEAAGYFGALSLVQVPAAMLAASIIRRARRENPDQ